MSTQSREISSLQKAAHASTRPTGLAARALTLVRVLLVTAVVGATLATPPVLLGAQEVTSANVEGPVVSTSAPTLPGAPFIADETRTAIVMERLDALTALGELEQAQENLSVRAGSDGDDEDWIILADTQRILESRVAAVQRQLDDLEPAIASLTADTEQFGLGIAIFPVDEARKPFWDDWGQSRSGGRSHVGTDVLAQIGIPLRAIEDGEVESITSGGLGGNGIFILGDSGSRYLYVHMNSIEDLEPGDRLIAGQQVGTVGDSGNASGAPHLHLQWAGNGVDWENSFDLLDVLFGQGLTESFMQAANEALVNG